MDIQKLMKQAQEMQKKFQKNSEEIKKKEFTGEAMGGKVSVVFTGDRVLRNINIDPSILADKETVEDLIIVAINDSLAKIEKESSSAMNDATGGMNIPGF